MENKSSSDSSAQVSYPAYRHVAVVRFSALGDIAMTVPVIASVSAAFPHCVFTVVSRPFAASFFKYLPSNVKFYPVDLKKEHKGLKGMHKLYGELKKEGIEALADLHDVLRTKFLRWLFSIHGYPVAHIDKGRKEKKALVKHQIFIQLKTSFKRYQEVFEKLGYSFSLSFERLKIPFCSPRLQALQSTRAQKRWIGIAPFAAHLGKCYPLNLMKQTLLQLKFKHSNLQFFLFGSSAEMQRIKDAWKNDITEIIYVADVIKEGLGEELQLMSKLDVMISMDSANMHLASLVGAPVVSVWGATHPFAGFLGYGQSEENIVRMEVECSPCSIYGNIPCRYGDYRCMKRIPPAMLVSKIEEILYK